MSDDQIREYLRSRAHGQPPPDLADAISRAADATPQQRPAWFAKLMPATLAVGAAGAVLVAAILATQGPPIGPSPTGTPAATTPSPAAATPTPEPSPSDQPIATVTAEGDRVAFETVDAEGAWGSGELVRGRDITRYPTHGQQGLYLLEVFVSYDAERLPHPAQFGASDWTLRPVDSDVTFYFIVEPINGRTELEPWPGPEPKLGQYPGAIDVLTTPTEGWIVFEVDARTLDYTLELVYWPAGFATPAASFIVRTAETAAPLAGETPPPQPGDPVYVERPGLSFSVLESAEADVLFDTPDACQNLEAGYEVTFPDDWYTNSAFADEPACVWFTPDFFTVDQNGEADPPVWISLQLIEGDYGYVGTTESYFHEAITVDGRGAVRSEYNSFPMLDPDHRSYDYVIALGDGPEEFGPTFVAGVSSDIAGDYELAKAVLDRIMASLVFDE